jgi:catechol 2,3-dioxygenase-like lactoylglutathione lyase family enzyme
MDFVCVRLQAPAAELPALTDFYGARLGMELEQVDDLLALTIGATRLEFQASEGEPFYHFALLAPGNRFEGALDWARERTELLPDPESGDVVFDFTNWDAAACYFHDPVGNIVEVIAHRGVGETHAVGSFAAAELLGLSELGLVGDTRAMARQLGTELGLELWDGTLDEPGRLAFVGEAARTLILSPAARPWLPTGREAEAHSIEVLLSGSPEREVSMEGSRYRVRRRAC